MVAEHVELALLEDTFVPVGGLQPPFSDRMSSIADRTGGTLLFDVRIFDDVEVERAAAIAYGPIGTALAVLMKGGEIRCVTVGRGLSGSMDVLTAWNGMRPSDQAATDCAGAAACLLATLRRAGHLFRAAG